MGSVESDLRQHESTEARAEAIYDAYASRVIEELVDDVICMRGIKYAGSTYTAVDFINNGLGTGSHGVEYFVASDEVAVLLGPNNDARQAVEKRLNAELAQRVRIWLEDSVIGQDIVMERCREWNEDDAQRHGEVE